MWNQPRCCFNWCLSPETAKLSVIFTRLDLELGTWPSCGFMPGILGFWAHPRWVSGELEVSLFLRSGQPALLVLRSFSKVLWDQRFRNERPLYLLWCVGTKLTTFSALGWKCQLMPWKGRAHRAHLRESDENGIRRWLVIGPSKWCNEVEGPWRNAGMNLWNAQAGFRVSGAMVFFWATRRATLVWPSCSYCKSQSGTNWKELNPSVQLSRDHALPTCHAEETETPWVEERSGLLWLWGFKDISRPNGAQKIDVVWGLSHISTNI